MTEQRPAAELRNDLLSASSPRRCNRRWTTEDRTLMAESASTIESLSAANLRLEQRVEELEQAAHDALEYFEGREDVDDGDYGQPKPNREMVLAMALRAAMGLTREGM